MKELRRQFYDQLLAWKDSKGKECLLVKGARQVGKTYIIRKFGRENYENFVATVLQRNGHPLRYYRNGESEVEFLVETSAGVVPVEVKAQTGRTLSLDKLLARPQVPFGYKLTGGNVGVSGKKITLPHYMAMFIRP